MQTTINKSEMNKDFTEIKGIEIANTDAFWSAWYNDRSRFLKGAIEQRANSYRFISYGDSNNRISVDVSGLSFEAIENAVTAVKDLIAQLASMSSHFTAELNININDQSEIAIEVLQ